MKNSIDSNPFRSWNSLNPKCFSLIKMKAVARSLICRTKWRLRIDRRTLTVGIALSLSGCMGVYEGGFECPPGEGVGCRSISEVNEMVNQGLGTRKQGLNTQPSEETQESVCRKGHACPSAPGSPEIWYAPRGLGNEPLGDESLRDELHGGEPSRNKVLLEV